MDDGLHLAQWPFEGVDLDAGFTEGRQFGRGELGAQGLWET